MRRLQSIAALLLCLAGYAAAQSNELLLADQQTTPNTFTWLLPPALSTSVIVEDLTPVGQGLLIQGETVSALYPATQAGIHAWYDATYHNAYMTTYGASGAGTPLYLNQSSTPGVGLAGASLVVPGIVSDYPSGSWQEIQLPMGGILSRGLAIGPTTANTGAYVDWAPILYSPTAGMTCVDAYMNPVGQPRPLNGLSGTLWTSGTQADVLAWNSASPLQGYQSPENGFVNVTGTGTTVTQVSGSAFTADAPGQTLFISGLPYPIYSVNSATSITLSSPAPLQTNVPFGGGWAPGVYPIRQTPCAPPLAVPYGAPFGLNINSYTFTLEGVATSSQGPNAIQTFGKDGINAAGGAYLGSIAIGSEMPAGTVTTAGTLTVQTFVGSGVLYMPGGSAWPAAGTFATTTVPLVQGYTIQPGEMSYNTSLDCFGWVNQSVAWGCIGNWKRSGSLVYANNTTDQVLIGRTSSSGNVALDITGKLSSGTYYAINALGVIQSYLQSGAADATTALFSGINAAGVQAFWLSGAGELALAGETPMLALSKPTGTPPSLAGTQSGMYYTGTGCNWEVWSNSGTPAWQPFNPCTSGSGGVTSLNSQTGALTLAGTTNEITVNTVGSTITLSTPQGICTACTPTFQTLATTGGIQINQSSGYGLYLPSSYVLAAGLSSSGLSSYGSISSTSGINAGTDSNGGFWVGGSRVINTSGQWVGGGVVTSLAGTTNEVSVSASTGAVTLSLPQAICTACAPTFANLYIGSGAGYPQVINTLGIYVGNGVNITYGVNYNMIQTTGGFAANTSGGMSGGNYAFTVDGLGVITTTAGVYAQGGLVLPSSASSTIYMGSGNFFLNNYTGVASSSLSCSGVGNGWFAVSSDNYLVVCNGSGTRYRAALASY
jgi:hypothetical protein